MPNTRSVASRQTAKASGRMSSRVSPAASRPFRSCVCPRSSPVGHSLEFLLQSEDFITDTGGCALIHACCSCQTGRQEYSPLDPSPQKSFLFHYLLLTQRRFLTRRKENPQLETAENLLQQATEYLKNSEHTRRRTHFVSIAQEKGKRKRFVWNSQNQAGKSCENFHSPKPCAYCERSQNIL